jgi:hypothetical protein
MDKKITDILSPREIEKKGFRGTPSENEEVWSPSERPKVKIPSAGKKLFIFVLAILVLAFVFCYFTLSRAKIDIWPETRVLSLGTTLTVDKGVKESNFLIKVIPGIVVEKEKTVTKSFPASSKVFKEEKATGTIRVYNEYSTASQVLVATTRFVSTEGKLFRTPEKVTVPGGHYEGEDFVPGEIDIKVVADQPGPDYNIGPSTFSVPGFAGTDRYTKFYAKSFQPMTGGYSEEVFQVTKEDLAAAEEVLTAEAKLESESALKDYLKSEEFSVHSYYLEKAIETEILGTFPLAEVGKEVENFDFQVKAKSETLTFKKEDIESFAREFILPQVPEGSELYEESLTINVSPETINLDSGKIILSLDTSAKIYSEIDTFVLKDNLKGRSLAETKIFLENQSGITKIKVEFWPFWVRRVPEDLDKIEFNLRID